MPWCPKCTYEYRNGFTHCSDCGLELVDEDPSPRRVQRNWIVVLELTSIFVFSYWVWAVMALASTRAEIPLPLLPPTAIVWGGGFVWGLIARFRVNLGTWLAALVIGAVVQAGVEVLAVTIGGGEAWKLILAVPVGVLFSSICLALVGVGSLVPARRRR